MKKEILRINDLNLGMTSAKKLEHISLCILEGEVVGFLGLTYSGKDILVRLISGDIPVDIQAYHVYLCGNKVTDAASMMKRVYHIKASNYTIDDWTVAEYIGLIRSSWLQMMWKKRILEEEIRAYFDTLGIPVCVSRKMKELTELEKRIVDIVKARRHGAAVLVIEDECEGMRPESIRELRDVMKRLTAGNMAVIINSHSEIVLSILSEKYIIFKKGRIVKKCRKEYIQGNTHLEKYLLETGITTKKKDLDSYTLDQTDKNKPVYRINGLKLGGGKKRDFSFLRGEVVTFLALDNKERERMFLVLSGRQTEEDAYYDLGSRKLRGDMYGEFARRKVVSVMHMGSREEVFAGMSPGENLLLPSLQKISSLEYITSSRKMGKMVKQSMGNTVAMTETAVENMEINDLISITMERWYIYNPKVLILFEPFQQCDIYGVSIVKSYIKKFANRGTAVIIIKSREEYMEDISDQIISID